jgi:hypothetical protein
VPPRASHIYFRDVIGNVSTSSVRVSGNSVLPSHASDTGSRHLLNVEQCFLTCASMCHSNPGPYTHSLSLCWLQRGIAALLPRTPLFGGWSTDFEFGFKLPLAPFQKRLPDGRTELRLMAGPQVKAITIDDYVVKVHMVSMLLLQMSGMLDGRVSCYFTCRASASSLMSGTGGVARGSDRCHCRFGN